MKTVTISLTIEVDDVPKLFRGAPTCYRPADGADPAVVQTTIAEYLAAKAMGGLSYVDGVWKVRQS